jgi:ankyrin repeat protein
MKKIIKQNSKININLKENAYGNTLLNLAVGNDKPIAVKILLENGADFNLADTFGYAPIHNTMILIGSRRHSAEILKLLLKQGCNPNLLAKTKNSADDKNPSIYTPLMGAIGNLECTKILLDSGADLYYKIDTEYLIWRQLLINDLNNSESIFVLEYIIVNKKMKIPFPIYYSRAGKKVGIMELITRFDVYKDIRKKNAKNRILNYLKV